MYILNFGKYKGQDIETVFKNDPDYVQWLSDKSNNDAARRAADKMIRATGMQDTRTNLALQETINDILDELDEQSVIVQDYRFEVRVQHGNKIVIDFEHGDLLNENWDILEISNFFLKEEEEEHYEGWEDTPRPSRPVSTLPTPDPQAAQWYAFPDNLEEKPLNAAPVTLTESIRLLEHHLAH